MSKQLDFNLKMVSLFGVILIFIGNVCQAQNLSAGARVMPTTDALFNGLPIARPASKVIGSVNLNEKMSYSTITLYQNDQVVDGYYARYNIYFNELDIRTQNGERALEGSKIKSFVFRDTLNSLFINAQDYTVEDVPLKGFLEVLADGAAPLFKFNYVIIKDPDWQPALNTGSRDTRIIKSFKFFTANGKALVEIKGKKKVLATFGDKTGDIEKFVKANSLSYSTAADLARIFGYYNSLTSGK